MSFSNRIAVFVNSPLLEREVRRTFNARFDYAKFLKFLSDEDNRNIFNRDDKYNDIVRAIYFCAQTVFKDNHFVARESEGHKRFLNALRMMQYEVDVAWNSIDAHMCVAATNIAANSGIDTVLLLGVTVDHEPLIWDLRSKGKKVIGFFADSFNISERIKNALHWSFSIKEEWGILSPLPTDNRNEDEGSLEEQPVAAPQAH